MKTGLEYAHSRDKRNFDLFVARSLELPVEIGIRALRATRLFPRDELMIVQERVGQHGKLFNLHKIQTLDDAEQPFNTLANTMRKLGLDELPQYRNVKNGTMSIVGHRPLLASEHQAVLQEAPQALAEQWQQDVISTRPGQISSYGIAAHTQFDEIVNHAELRTELDIEDVMKGSLRYDAALLAHTFTQTLANKMRHGRISHDS